MFYFTEKQSYGRKICIFKIIYVGLCVGSNFLTIIMENSNRVKVEDQIFNEDIKNKNFCAQLFIRVGAKKKRFEEVDFSHTYFENCYFKDCVFDSCNFNGCKITNSNFSGSSFTGSKFDYASFDKTQIENEILFNNCPTYDNLKLKFARSLRTNFQSIGDAVSANKAIKIELKATESHLKKNWNSKESYYRKKYAGLRRFEEFFKWISFKIQEFIWGNGESLLKLFRTGFYIWIFLTIIDVFSFKNKSLIENYWKSFWEMPALFFGVGNNNFAYYDKLYLSIIVAIRLIGLSLFMSILIKRFNKR